MAAEPGVRRVQAEGPSLSALLERRAASSTAPALLAPGRRPLRYSELAEQVAAAAARLGELGIGRGDRIALLVPNGPEAVTAFLGISAAAVCAPLNPPHTAAELEFFLGQLRPRALVVDERLESPARDVAAARGIALVD